MRPVGHSPPSSVNGGGDDSAWLRSVCAMCMELLTFICPVRDEVESLSRGTSRKSGATRDMPDAATSFHSDTPWKEHAAPTYVPGTGAVPDGVQPCDKGCAGGGVQERGVREGQAERP